MSKIKAYIKSPTGYIHEVDVEGFNIGHGNGCVTITATDGETYYTHLSNTLLVESEVLVPITGGEHSAEKRAD